MRRDKHAYTHIYKHIYMQIYKYIYKHIYIYRYIYSWTFRVAVTVSADDSRSVHISSAQCSISVLAKDSHSPTSVYVRPTLEWLLLVGAR